MNDDVLNLLEHLFFELIQHIRHIPIMQIEGTSVDIGAIGDIGDGNRVYAFSSMSSNKVCRNS